MKKRSSKSVGKASPANAEDGRKPLFALISQVLVAYTVELDNAFEKKMSEAGYVGAGLSWAVWAKVMKYVGEGIRVEELARLNSAKDLYLLLGCLERWTFVTFEPAESEKREVRQLLHARIGRELRDGWGSGRGIRREWIIRPTSKGQKAIQIWPALFETIEGRWRARFGEKQIAKTTEALINIVAKLKLPAETDNDEALQFPRLSSLDPENHSLLILLSVTLTAFAMEFRAESRVSLGLCANLIRVLSEKPIRASDVARLTGASKERVAIGWREKAFVLEERDPNAKRGTVVKLNKVGLAAQKEFWRLVNQLEVRHEEKFGRAKIDDLRACMEEFLAARKDSRLLITEALLPPEGIARAGFQVPALGRRDVGAAAKQRMKDLLEQTRWFVQDPLGSLPWFPLWDMNRGFGL